MAYHGTSEDRAAKIAANGFALSRRTASWLGFGAYFFFQAPNHCAEWAVMTARRRGVRRGVVLRVTLDLRNSINLLDRDHWDGLRHAYSQVPPEVSQVGPGYLYDPTFADHNLVGWNYRDCAAVNAYAEAVESLGKPVHSIIAAFSEGRPVSPNSWLFDQSSVIVCVRDPGVVRVDSQRFIDAGSVPP